MREGREVLITKPAENLAAELFPLSRALALARFRGALVTQEEILAAFERGEVRGSRSESGFVQVSADDVVSLFRKS